MKKLMIILGATVFVSAAILSSQSEPAKLFIKNATIIPVTGERIGGGSILVEDGKIKAVGKTLQAPTDAKVIDASGMFVYPGFIDSYSHFGLAEIGAIASTTDYREMGKENPELRVAWAINPHSVHFGTGRVTGTTTALVAPSGGTFPGISALVKMDGWTLPEMAFKEDATSFISCPMTPRPVGEGVAVQKEAKEDVTSKLVEKIRDYLKEARRYLALKKLAAGDPSVKAPEYNAKYEALGPVLDGTLPVIVSVEKAKDIELAKAGVLISFSSGDSPAQGKDLPYHAAKAAAFGLPQEEALRALTINPAKIFGVADRLGSIEVGKDADLFIARGDPLDMRTEVRQLVINGRAIDMSNWWETLYDKFKKRPEK